MIAKILGIVIGGLGIFIIHDFKIAVGITLVIMGFGFYYNVGGKEV